MTRSDSQNNGPASGDVVRDHRTDEAAAQDHERRRRRSPAPVGVGEPAVPMSPTPHTGPIGDEAADPAEPTRPPGETIR
jgi:hypothetical protein